MSRPRLDVVVLTMNDRPAEEAAAQATLLAQSGVDVRVVVVGNGCKPEVVPPGALTVCPPGNIGIPGGRNAGADALRDAGDPAAWLYFLDNDAAFPRPRRPRPARRRGRAAFRSRLGAAPADGPGRCDHPAPLGPPAARLEPGTAGKAASMTEGVVLIRRDAFDAVGGREGQLFLYHEGFDLAWRLSAAGWSGWYAAGIRMHHPLTTPARHALYHRLAARNRIWIAYRNLPAPFLPLYLGAWTVITLARAVRGSGLRQTLRGMREGWTTRRTQPRRPMNRRTVYRLTAAGRPPVIWPSRQTPLRGDPSS